LSHIAGPLWQAALEPRDLSSTLATL
jgi:hypothetical protein